MEGKFTWLDEYSVNDKTIDDQHKQFFNIVNSIIELTEGDSFTEEDALMKVGQLGSYAFYHLESEEKIFKNTEYKEIDEHITIHNKFREDASGFIGKVEEESEDKKTVIREVAKYAGEWLRNHIITVDKGYAEFVK